MKELFTKPITFRQYIYILSLIIIVEITLRLLWHPTTLSLLLPAIVACMFRKLNLKPVKLKVQMWSLLPFIVATPLYIIIYRQTEEIESNVQLFLFLSITYSATNFLLLLPTFMEAQKGTYMGLEQKKHNFLQLITLFLLINASLVALLVIIYFHVFINGASMYPIDIVSNIISVLLIIILVIIAQFLFQTQGIRDESMVNKRELMKSLAPRIEDNFSDTTLYLDADLSLQKFHLTSNIPMDDLKCFFDNYLNLEFLDYVAEYRILYAMQLMMDTKNRYTIETIAHESGYRSKTSFIKYFKQKTGKTPSEYMKKLTAEKV